jgi:hypothetical protein
MARLLGMFLGFMLVSLNMRSAQAGEPPTARIMVNPVPAKVGPPYPPLADGGPNIVGNELRLDAGGVRVWVEVHLADWDPNADGSPPVDTFQVTLLTSGLLDADIDGDGDVTDDGDQQDIALTMVPCTSRADCQVAFGENLPDIKCDSGMCRPVYADKNGNRADGWCAGGFACSCGENAVIRESFWRVAGCYVEDVRPDDGTVRWGAGAVYDVPPGAKGKYTVNLNTDQSYIADSNPPFGEPTSLVETGFVINVLTGRCCYGFGTPSEGCIDAVTRAECGDDEPGPVAFIPEEACPPEGPICTDDFGACCNTLLGTCQARLAQIACQGSHFVWSAGLSCENVDCGPVLGACCDHDPFEPCRVTIRSACQCAHCTWHKLQSCTDLDCPAGAIPTASSWGLTVLSLSLMTGAKVIFGSAANPAAV